MWPYRRRPPPEPVLCHLTPDDPLYLTALMCHVAILASIGSGKTLSILHTLVNAALRAGVACCFACSKPTDGPMYAGWCRQANVPYVRFQPGGETAFDVLDFLSAEFPVGEVAASLDSIQEQMTKSSGLGGGHADPYWQLKASEWQRHGMTILQAAGVAVSVDNLAALFRGLARSPEQVISDSWKQSDVAVLLNAAAQKGGHRRDVAAALDFALLEFPGFDNRPRSSVESHVTLVQDRLRQYPAGDIFAGGRSTYHPQMTTRQGVSVILDTPALQWGDPGRFGQVLALSAIAKYRLARSTAADPVPVVLVCDEASLWARLGRINAEKRNNGRGPFRSWVVSHAELLRYRREGLLLLHHN